VQVHVLWRRTVDPFGTKEGCARGERKEFEGSTGNVLDGQVKMNLWKTPPPSPLGKAGRDGRKSLALNINQVVPIGGRRHNGYQVEMSPKTPFQLMSQIVAMKHAEYDTFPRKNPSAYLSERGRNDWEKEFVGPI